VPCRCRRNCRSAGEIPTSSSSEVFNITHVPNGTYYIEVIVNPEKVLHESDTSNDISLRKVILGGTRDHRTVRVPAYHGIDPEH
jgi:hypothetical protein